MGAAIAVIIAAAFASPATQAATTLSQERVYEMVSPPYKDGFGAGGTGVITAMDGEHVWFGSQGDFAGNLSDLELGNTYTAARGPNGWQTVGANPPPSLAPPSSRPEAKVILEREALKDYSPDGLYAIAAETFASSSSTLTRSFAAFYRREQDGTFVDATQPLQSSNVFEISYVTASTDLRHLILKSPYPLEQNDTVEDGLFRLYEVTDNGGAASAPKLVGLDDSNKVIDPFCAVYLGSGGVSAFHAVSANGSEVFFTTNVNPLEEKRCDEVTKPGQRTADPASLFVRIDGQTTLDLSSPPAAECTEEPCSTAERQTAVFQGASEDGSRAFFTTTQPLLNNDNNGANDLYMVVIRDREVDETVLLSTYHQRSPEPANVQGIIRISDDGSHVYFVASGVLAGENPEGRSPEAGADNLYVANTTDRTVTFVAALKTTAEIEAIEARFNCDQLTGAARRRCEREKAEELATESLAPRGTSPLWEKLDDREAQTTPDGEFLVFATYARLTSDDTDNAKDIYRFSAKDGRLVRVSKAEQDSGITGNDSESNAMLAKPSYVRPALEEQDEMRRRALSNDGETIVFRSSGALSPRAINGLPDIYVWHGGNVSMVSSGDSLAPDEEPVIDPSGRDIFFRTTSSLVPQDTDGLYDVYDARMGGGFPPSPSQAPGCVGDECQGAMGGAPLWAPPSSDLISGEERPSRKVVGGHRRRRASAAVNFARAVKLCRKKPHKRRVACIRKAKRQYRAALRRAAQKGTR